jgi:hypothetical protein
MSGTHEHWPINRTTRARLLHRRAFVTGGVAGLAALADSTRPSAAAMPATLAEPVAIGRGKLLVIEEGPLGRIVAVDSATYATKELKPTDVFLAGSYCATAAQGPPFGRGVKAIIALDAGIGKDEAGITALATGEQHGVPVASVATLSAEVANGRSVAWGTISRANAPARALGVAPGQLAYDAAVRMLNAPLGKPIEVAATWDEHPHVVEEYPRGKIWASTSSFVFKRKMPTDVICIAANSGRVFAESLIEIGPRGGIANDSGMGKNNSGIAGLKILAEAGIAACSVAAMSARIGDGMSTWNDGVISAANAIAMERGVKVGITAKEAARLML